MKIFYNARNSSYLHLLTFQKIMKNFFSFAVLLFIFFTTTTTTFAQRSAESNKKFFLQGGRGIYGEDYWKGILEYKKVEGSPTFHGQESSALGFGYYFSKHFDVIGEYGDLGTFSIEGKQGDTFAFGSEQYSFGKDGKLKVDSTYFGLIFNGHLRAQNFDFFGGAGLARVNTKVTYSGEMLEKGTISKLGKSRVSIAKLLHIGMGYHIYDFFLYVGAGNGAADLFGLRYSFY